MNGFRKKIASVNGITSHSAALQGLIRFEKCLLKKIDCQSPNHIFLHSSSVYQLSDCGARRRAAASEATSGISPGGREGPGMVDAPFPVFCVHFYPVLRRCGKTDTTGEQAFDIGCLLFPALTSGSCPNGGNSFGDLVPCHRKFDILLLFLYVGDDVQLVLIGCSYFFIRSGDLFSCSYP